MNAVVPNLLMFSVAVASWTASEAYGALTHLIHRSRAAKLKGDRGSLIVYYLGIGAFLACVAALPDSGAGGLPTYLFYIGISLMFAGIVLRQWAIASLRGSFSLSVVVRDGQKIVDTGPYRSVRHPSYTGIAATVVGFGLALRSFDVLALSAIIFVPILVYRIKVEEVALKSVFGEEYSEYMERTKRLIPFLF